MTTVSIYGMEFGSKWSCPPKSTNSGDIAMTRYTSESGETVDT